MSKIHEVFIEYQASLRRYLARFRLDDATVDDYLQETFLRGFAAELRGEIRKPKAYLFRVAKNIALVHFRTNERSPTDFVEDRSRSEFIIDESHVDASEQIDGRQKLALFAAAVCQLSPQCRRAFWMRRVEELKYKQIANRMNISVSAVEKHVAKGLIECNAYLCKHGYHPSEFGAKSKPKSKQSQRCETIDK